LNKKVAAPV